MTPLVLHSQSTISRNKMAAWICEIMTAGTSCTTTTTYLPTYYSVKEVRMTIVHMCASVFRLLLVVYTLWLVHEVQQ